MGLSLKNIGSACPSKHCLNASLTAEATLILMQQIHQVDENSTCLDSWHGVENVQNTKQTRKMQLPSTNAKTQKAVNMWRASSSLTRGMRPQVTHAGVHLFRFPHRPSCLGYSRPCWRRHSLFCAWLMLPLHAGYLVQPKKLPPRRFCLNFSCDPHNGHGGMKFHMMPPCVRCRVRSSLTGRAAPMADCHGASSDTAGSPIGALNIACC